MVESQIPLAYKSKNKQHKSAWQSSINHSTLNHFKKDPYDHLLIYLKEKKLAHVVSVTQLAIEKWVQEYLEFHRILTCKL